MRIAFIIFDKITALDFIGIYDPITRLKSMNFMPELDWNLCSLSRTIVDDKGLIFTATEVAEPLEKYDLLIVPGGFGTRDLLEDKIFIEWLKTAAFCKLKTSVCTGSLLLGAAGFLQGKRATTHQNAFQNLLPFCEEVIDERIVDEGSVITARGVTSAIDLGLYLVEKFIGLEGKEQICRQMDYQSTMNIQDNKLS